MALTNSTPHIGAHKGEIAKRVIMPGDPQRAKWIAKTFLKNAKLVSDVRGMLAYTGMYKNVPITVMAHGMGIPSICIYVHELYSFYGAQVIYRVGSCGVTNAAHAKLGDVILTKSCWSDVPIKHWTKVKPDAPNRFYPTPSCVKNILETAKEKGIVCKQENAFSATFFYNSATFAQTKKLSGASVSEMEGFGLFLEAKSHKRKAACLLTVSDNMETGEAMTALARATTFHDMAELALEAIIKERV
ncbi:MAG: purine-nucleoside phosphorylase [Mycoplasma sp.]|nr:purine-nucleoside phosphorylase [Candidatus Hennigella equi]